MKKLLLLASLTAFIAVSAIAQEKKEVTTTDKKEATAAQDKKDAKQTASEWEKKFKEDLKLSNEQSAKFDALNKEYKEKIDAVLKDATLTQEVQKEKKMALKKEKEAKLLEFLTPEQQAKYKEMKEEMEKKKAEKQETAKQGS